MLSISNLSKSFGARVLFKGVNFHLNSGGRIGLIGPNGCGKSTLLKMLVGEESIQQGSVNLSPSILKRGYLPQGLRPDDHETIGSFLTSRQPDVSALGLMLEELTVRIMNDPENEALAEEYSWRLGQMEMAAQVEGKRQQILAGLGFAHYPLSTRVDQLSGGLKSRLALAGVLLSEPPVLLLDEPTNHLDIDMLEWLEDWLMDFQGSILFVSHDRIFLEHMATHILEMDPLQSTVKVYTGCYSQYLEQKQAERDRQWQEYSDQQEEIVKIRRAAAHLRSLTNLRRGGKADSGDKFARGFFANRSLETMGRAKQLERKLEHLLGDGRIEKPRRSWEMKVAFDMQSSGGKDVLVMEDLSIGYDIHHPLVVGIRHYVRQGARVAIIGVNGSGKTTLLKTIAGQLPPLSGNLKIGSSIKIGYLMQEQENLDMTLTPFQTMFALVNYSETEIRAYLHYYLFTEEHVFTPVGSLSYGERARLALACLTVQGCNLLLLDEPINHLDIPARNQFERALSKYEGTVVAAVHDRYFIRQFASEIWRIENDHLMISLEAESEVEG